MLAMTVEGPSLPPTVELVDPRTREWEPVDREPSLGPVAADPTLETVTARDGLTFTGWLFRPPGRNRADRRDAVPARRTRGPGAARVQRVLPASAGSGHLRVPAERAGFGRFRAHPSCTPTTRSERFAAIDDVADAAAISSTTAIAPADRIACCGWSYGGYLTQAALTFHPDVFAAGISICGMSDLNYLVPQHRTVDRRGGVSEIRPPRQRSRPARGIVAAAAGRRDDRAAAAGARAQRHQRPAGRVATDVRRPADAGSKRRDSCSSTTTATRSTSGRTAPCWSTP